MNKPTLSNDAQCILWVDFLLLLLWISFIYIIVVASFSQPASSTSTSLTVFLLLANMTFNKPRERLFVNSLPWVVCDWIKISIILDSVRIYFSGSRFKMIPDDLQELKCVGLTIKLSFKLQVLQDFWLLFFSFQVIANIFIAGGVSGLVCTLLDAKVKVVKVSVWKKR